MMDIYSFKKFFNSLLDKKDTNKLLEILSVLIKNHIFNIEFTINLVKGLVLIFYLDKTNFTLYYSIFNELAYNSSKTLQKKIYNTVKNMDFSLQFCLNEYVIENIILYTNNILIDTNLNLDQKIDFFFYLINKLKNLSISFNYKIQLYIYFTKNYQVVNFDNCISLIKNFIK